MYEFFVPGEYYSGFPTNFEPNRAPAIWCNAVQEEICSVIESAGFPLGESDFQLRDVINLILSQDKEQFVFELPHLESQLIPIPWAPVADPKFANSVLAEFYLTVVSHEEGSTGPHYLTGKYIYTGSYRGCTALNQDRFPSLIEVRADGNIYCSPQAFQGTGVPVALIFSHLRRISL